MVHVLWCKHCRTCVLSCAEHINPWIPTAGRIWGEEGVMGLGGRGGGRVSIWWTTDTLYHSVHLVCYDYYQVNRGESLTTKLKKISTQFNPETLIDLLVSELICSLFYFSWRKWLSTIMWNKIRQATRKNIQSAWLHSSDTKYKGTYRCTVLVASSRSRDWQSIWGSDFTIRRRVTPWFWDQLPCNWGQRFCCGEGVARGALSSSVRNGLPLLRYREVICHRSTNFIDTIWSIEATWSDVAIPNASLFCNSCSPEWFHSRRFAQLLSARSRTFSRII